MSKKYKPIWTFEKTIKLSIEQVEAILFDIKEGDFKKNELPFILKGKTNCVITKRDTKFSIAFEDGHKEYVEIDKLNHTLSTQGEWWYRGLYTLIQEGDVTSIKFQIFNVAERYRWVASLMVLPEKNTHKNNFENFVTKIETAN